MKSIRTKHVARATRDLYLYYMKWALIVVGASLVIRAAIWVFAEEMQTLAATPLTLFRGPGQTFMLVIGIVTGVFVIAYYIRQGVTRRSFLLAGVLTGVAIAVSLQIVGFVFYGLIALVEPLLPVTLDASGTPYDGTSGLAVGVAVDTLLATAFYLMGWVIGFAFYRFRFLGGMASVFAGILVLGSLTSLWGEEVEINITGIRIPPIDGLPVGASIIVTGVILAAQLACLYFIVRNAPLKVR